MMTAVSPGEAGAAKGDVESGFDAVLNVGVTGDVGGVTYAGVTSMNCVSSGSNQQTTKELFESLGLEVPRGIRDSYVLQTPGRHGNCLLYSVAKLIYKNPSHRSVDDMRLKLQSYISNSNVESI